MLAERTDEHLEVFEEDRDAGYFGTPDEMIDKIRFYLANEPQRRHIAEAGYRKVLAGRHTYTDRLFQIIDAAERLRGDSVARVAAVTPGATHTIPLSRSV